MKKMCVKEKTEYEGNEGEVKREEEENVTEGKERI